uniref:SUEL-type lectin domain-containing protein n=1 Tax=Myripristis murdjan TaxID=586833 RepID=A0A667YL57_9TELE
VQVSMHISAMRVLACIFYKFAVYVVEIYTSMFAYLVAVISVVSSFYGRADRVTCSAGRPAAQLANTACSLPGTLEIVKTSCNGRNSCTIYASNSVFGDPCRGTFKYLELAYTCECKCLKGAVSLSSAVISVVSSFYGRADRVTCSAGRPAAQLANTGCSLPGTLEIVKTRCNGKRVCELNANTLRASDPCNGTYKYMDTTFICLPASESDMSMMIIVMIN